MVDFADFLNKAVLFHQLKGNAVYLCHILKLIWHQKIKQKKSKHRFHLKN